MKLGSILGEEMRKKSKKDLVLIHLQMHKSITQWEAIEKFKSTRLAAIIHTLRHKDGYNITSKSEYNKTTGTNYDRYTLHQENASTGQFALL
jgi:hypothetical protein